MKSKKTLAALLLTLCMTVFAVFAFTSCENDDDQTPTPSADSNYLVAGTYTNTVTDTEKCEYKLIVANDGSFELSVKRTDGHERYESAIGGKMSVDQNRRIKSLSFADMSGAFLGNEFLFDTLLPPDDYINSTELNLLLPLIAEKMPELLDFEITESYVLITAPGTALILYKDGAKRLDPGTELGFLGEKQIYEKSAAMDLNSLISGSDFRAPYVSDYYFVKDAYDLNSEEDKKNFIATVEDDSLVLAADHLGNAVFKSISIEEISGFDLTKTGDGTGVIKYKSGDKTVTKAVTYTVVEKEDALPRMQLMTLERGNFSNAPKVEKGTQLYDCSWRLEYKAFGDYWTEDLYINEANCTGDDKVIDIIGYDPEKTGFQTVTIKFRNKEIKIVVFVYSDDYNPVSDVSMSGNVTIVKTNDGTQDIYTLDCSDLKFKVEKMKGSAEYVDAKSEDAIDLDDLKNYEPGDEIVFVYTTEFDGKTYTFYACANVSINDMTKK